MRPVVLSCVAALFLAGLGCGGASSSGTSASGTASSASASAPSGAESGGEGSAAAPAESGEETERDSAAYQVLVFGNSITAGAGVADEEAFPARLQEKADSVGYSARIIEAGVSGETTAGGLRRIEHVMRPGIDVLVLELGGNDGLRGTDPPTVRSNLQQIIDRARSINPDLRIVLTGIRMPPNMGPAYTKAFREVYTDLGAENELVLIPRLLEGVGGRPEFMQSDGIHPNVRGHRRVADTVWEELRPVLEELGAGTERTARVVTLDRAVQPAA